MKAQIIKSKVLLSVALIGLAGLGGCAAGPTSLPLFHPPELSGPEVKVIVSRKKQVCASYPLTYLLIDDVPISALANGQYTRFSASPGHHTLSVRFHIIDAPLLLGAGAAAIPVGIQYGRYGSSVSAEFLEGSEYKFLITANCTRFDENERFAIEEKSDWPADANMDSYKFVAPGPQE